MEFEVENGGVVLRGRVQGPDGAAATHSDAVPVLLVHGACVDGSFWDAAAATLAERFRVATYDRRGYGRSPLSAGAEPDCSVAPQAEDAATIIRALGAPAHVVAHSGGCAIAMELAAAHPELVARLVLDEPLFYDCAPAEGAFATTSERIRGALARGNHSLALHLFMPTLGATDPASRAQQPSAEASRANCDHFIHHEYLALSRFCPDYETLARADVRIVCSELPHGEQYPACAAELARRIDAPLVPAPGAHNFPADRPEEFAALVAGLLAPAPASEP